VSERTKLYLLAFACGLISQALLLVVVTHSGEAGAPFAGLFLLEAGILGWVFGPYAGVLGAALPWPFIAIPIAGRGDSTAQDVTGIVYIALLVALVAFMVGSLRARYGRRGRRPGGPRR
jgi:hypothetical protein